MAFNRILLTSRFISKEPYIDKTRMGVYGRVREPLPRLQQCRPSTVDDVTASLHPSSIPPPQAYGGYLATMLLSSEEFTQLKCGAVVSPITDFEIYGIVFIRFPSCRALQPLTLASFCPAASAFSERYLGSKTDSRAYTVRALELGKVGGHGGASSKMLLTLLLVFVAVSPPTTSQMANLVHRAHQLLQKQYLIIHPTADGKKKPVLPVSMLL